MLFPVRLTPTVKTAFLSTVTVAGSPEMETPTGITPPRSLPFGPVLIAGEPACALNHCFRLWASAQFVKYVRESGGRCVSVGAAVECPGPGPDQGSGIKWFTKV